MSKDKKQLPSSVKPRKPLHPGFTSLQDIIKRQFPEVKVERFAPSTAIQQQWKNIVGDVTAEHCRVLYIKSEILHVAVHHSTWLSELSFMKGKILTQLRILLPQIPIIDIKFKVQS